jgi:catechol-2,3-dioxygenase
MNFNGVVVNVADLNRSIDFYREVFGFAVQSQQEQLAALGVSESNQSQVLVLRALGSAPLPGARHIGQRAFIVEVESVDELQRIASELDSRKLLVNRREHSEWTAVVGRDPDHLTFVVTWHPDRGSSTQRGREILDDFLYGIGE